MKLSIISLITLLLLLVSPIYGKPFIQEKEKKHKHKSEQKQEDVKRDQNVSMLIDAKKAEITGDTDKSQLLFRQYIEKYPDDPVGYFELAQILAARHETSEAEKLIRKASDLDPENVWYSLFLAEIDQLNGNFKDAVSIYNELIKKKPQELDYYYQLAALYIMEEKYGDAAKTYDKVEEIIGVTEEISLQKEKIYLQLNNIQKAQDELEKLVRAFPENSRYLSILAEFYLGTNHPEKALETYKKISDVDPGNPYIYISMADYYRKKGDREKAYENLRQGFKNPDLSIDTKITVLMTFYSVKDLYQDQKAQALDLARILVDVHPDDPKSHSIYGDLLSQDKKYDSARVEFMKAVSLDSSKYVIWEELLRLDLEAEDMKLLGEHSQKVIELFPEQPLPYLFSGLANYQLKDFNAAVNSLNQGAKLVVDNSELLSQFYMYLGDSYHALNNQAESDKNYQKSLDLKGDNAYVLNNFAYYLSIRNEDLPKAETMAKKAVTLDPENGSFQDTYGWVLYKLGKYEEARIWIAKALEEKDGPSAEVMEHYGDVLFKLGNTDQAIEFWQKAKTKGDGSKFLDKKIAEKKLIE